MGSSEMFVYPTSEIQRQFWLISRLTPETSAYNVSSVFRIKGSLNISALEDGLKVIIDRHEIFRTTFSVIDGELAQIVKRADPLKLEVVNLETALDSGNETEIEHQVRNEIDRPFDLVNGPLLRVKILKINDNEHILTIIFHHAIIDLQSKDMFAAELSNLYKTISSGLQPSEERPAKQYRDYAIWQQAWRKGDKFSAMLAYWNQQFRNRNCFLNLPTDKPRPAVQRLRGKKHRLHLDRFITEQLKLCGSRNKANLYLILLTAYAILLKRHSGQNDIVIGVPLSNRRHSDFKEVIGCFVNILPLAIDLPGNLTFIDTLAHVRRAMLGAHRNQEIPLQAIVDQVQAKRDASYNPVYQVGFTFEHPMDLRLVDLSVEFMHVENSGSQLDLFLTMWESAGEMYGHLEFNGDLFNEDTIHRFAENYATLLHTISEHTKMPICQLPVLSDFEKRKLLVQWNSTQIDLPENYAVHNLFEDQADKTPDAVAAEYEKDQINYFELNKRANQLARYLRDQGADNEPLVGIYMERSIDMLVALLAVLKAGGAYVPLDPEFPNERIHYMVEHSQAILLLTQSHLKHRLPECQAKVIALDEAWIEISRFEAQNLQNPQDPSSPAYVIYTSGSTGKPKGVKVPHSAVVNFLISMSREPGLSRDDTIVAVTSLSFDIAVLELFLPLTVGAKVVIVSRETALDGMLLAKTIRDSNATILQATPTTWRILLTAGWRCSSDFKMLCGGEAMPSDLATSLAQRSSYVWNMYGPTETTVWSTIWRLPSRFDKILVGRPIANTQIYILDEMMQPVPIGVTGELCIGGRGVTLGYLNRPDLTDAQFIDNPVDADCHGKIYKTGDIARYLADGNIEVLGRTDHQVKVRGYRIELGEIETILGDYPAIDQAVVRAFEDNMGSKYLTAYYTLKKSCRLSTSELQEYLNGRMPNYMVPSFYTQLDAMPLTPNGKIDRKALSKPENTRPDLKQAYTPPENEMHAAMTDIWEEVLKMDKVGIHDRFFEIGGNSLLAVQALAIMEKRLNKKIPVVALFQYPTIKTLSDYLLINDTKPQNSEKDYNRAVRKKTVMANRRERAIR